MKQFSYTVKSPRGIGAIIANHLTEQAKEYPGTTVTLTKGNQTVRLGQLLKLLTMKIRQGDRITLRCDGPDEENAFEVMGWYLCDNL